MEQSNLFFHPPGALSRSGVLDVGLKCAHSCRFCYYSFMAEAEADRDGGHNPGGQFAALRHASFRSTPDCLEIIDRMAGFGLMNFDVTGGEPAMHEGLPDMVRRARALGMSVRVITLSQFLQRQQGPQLLDALLDAGVTDFLFSLHASTEEGFREATRGSLKKVLAAMDALDAKGFQYAANTVIHAGNLADLPDIARISVSHGVYHHNFIVFNAYYRWDSPESIAGLQAAYTDIAGPLTEAVRILTDAGRAVTIRYLPLCAAPHLARHIVGVVGVHHDPHEWMNRAGNPEREPAYCAEPLAVPVDGPRDIYALSRAVRRLDFDAAGAVDTVAQRGDAFKVFPERCATCAAMDYCDGLDPKYILLHGTAGLAPFAGAGGSPPLLAERRAYLPAFAVKLTPEADMLGAIGRVLGKKPLEADPLVTAIVAPGPEADRAATLAALKAQSYGLAEIVDCGPGKSAGAAFNAAAKSARGPVLAFFPAGAVPQPDALARGVEFLARRPELSFAGQRPCSFMDLLAGAEAFGPNCAPLILRREAFEDAGGFQEGLGDCLFWDFRLAAAAAGHFGESGQDAATAGQRVGGRHVVDARHIEFPLVVRRTPHIFPREAALAHAQAHAGKKEPL